MLEAEAIHLLSSTIEKCGVPKLAINNDSNIRLFDGRVLRTDIVIVAADGETPLAVFEIKTRGKKTEIYNWTKAELGCLMEKGVKVFAVTLDVEGRLIFAQIGARCKFRRKWQSLHDLRKALGNYALASLRVQERLNINEARLSRFRHWVVFVGIATVADFVLIEEIGIEFSWKIYLLIGLLFSLYAASYGFNIKLSINGNEISICPKNERSKDEE